MDALTSQRRENQRHKIPKSDEAFPCNENARNFLLDCFMDPGQSMGIVVLTHLLGVVDSALRE
jgi:hypothetical protein